MHKLKVAVVGATGAVGQEFLRVLQERNFPCATLSLFASARSEGKTMRFLGENLPVRALSEAGLAGHDLAFFSAGASVSREYAPPAARAGVLVIDNSSAFRMDPEVPLVVPEVNPGDIAKHSGIIANPNCSTIIMVVVLKPIHDAATVKRVVVSTYQAVSGAGARAMSALFEEARAYLAGGTVTPGALPFASAPRHYQIAFNLIPQIDVFQDMGYTKEEWKMVRETEKIMGPGIAVTATTVRVPVERCHSESLNIETRRKLCREEVREILARAPGVSVVDDPEKMLYPMPLLAAGKNEVQVGRVREDNSIECGLNLWVVGDQLRKGAALNAVQIAEEALRQGVI
ncbi:MAG: aspartate-semialdehyde dehydrogenase [Clostridia bacterium]